MEKLKSNNSSSTIKSDIATRPKVYIKSFYDEIVKKLYGEGYLTCEIKSFQVGGLNRTFAHYSLTPKAQTALKSPSSIIILPVPEKLREEAREEELKKAQEVAELQEYGLDTDFLVGEDSDVINATLRDSLNWIRMIKRYRENGNSEYANAKEELLSRIMSWRQDTAEELEMAKEAVMKESLALRIAYSQASSVESLEALGLRIRGVERLSEIISSSLAELGLRIDTTGASSASASDTGDDDDMIFPSGTITIHSSKMKLSSKTSGKITIPSWRISYDNFIAGVVVAAIAPMHAKPILVTTVIGHLLDAFHNGYGLDLNRLLHECKAAGYPFPTRKQCDLLEAAAKLLGLDPATEELSSKSVLQCIPELRDIFTKDPNSLSLTEKSSSRFDMIIAILYYI